MPDLSLAIKQELDDKRQKAYKAGRDIIERSEKNGGVLTADDERQFEAYFAEGDKLTDQINGRAARAKRIAELEKEIQGDSESRGRRVPGEEIRDDENDDQAMDPEVEKREQESLEQIGGSAPVRRRGQRGVEVEYRHGGHAQKVFVSADMATGLGARSDVVRGGAITSMVAFRNFLRGDSMDSLRARAQMEKRSPNSWHNDVSEDGGNLHAPLQFVAYLIKKLNDAVYIRNRATVYPVTSSDTLGVPTLTTDLGDAEWTTENANITPDVSAQIGRRDLKPNRLAKLVKVSRKLMMTSILSPEVIIAERLMYKFAIAEETGYLTGSGTNEPLGIYTASANGVDTSRDVTIGTGSGGTITFDGLLDMQGHLRLQYRKNAVWNMSRSVWTEVRKIRDQDGRFIWQAGGLLAGSTEFAPPSLLGSPVDESEYAPAYTPGTTESGDYLMAYFDPQQYWIADLFGFELIRANELFLTTNEIGFFAGRYTDGAPVLADAFVRGKIA